MYEYENEHRPVENQQSYAYNFSPEPPVHQPEQHPQKKRGGAGKVVALLLACALVGGASGVGASLLTGSRQTTAQTETAAQPEASSSTGTTLFEGQRETEALTVAHVDTSRELTAAEVYAENVNSTVGITTSITTNYWGYQTQSAAAGSGFILTADGYILTNYHVVEDSNSITVSLYDGSSYDAKLIGYDENNDIAVLKIDATGLQPVVLGSSDDLHVGDQVVAIGNPLGELTFSLTAGMVSALNREVTFSNGLRMSLIQTDAAINSGNSGGALFNMYGEVVGITNAKYGSSSSSSGTASIDNIGFAIPIDDVRSIVESIIENGYIVKPYIGVSVQNVSSESQQLGLPQGAAVAEVVADSPAEQSGLQVNDIITAVNGTAITGSTDLVNTVKGAAIGDELTLSVYRQGKEMELTLTVGEKTQDALPQTDSTQSSQDNSQQQQQDGQQYGYSYGQGGFPFNFFN